MGMWHVLMLAMFVGMDKCPMMRTWAALFLSGCAGLFIPPDWIGAYMLVDLTAGYIVVRRPAGVAQKSIGAIFVMMVIFHIGFMTAMALGRAVDGHVYGVINRGAGWLQLLCLMGWGLWNAMESAVDRYRAFRGRALAQSDLAR